jgi:hypothetical protein
LGYAGASHELSHRTVFKKKIYNDFFFFLFSFLLWNNPIIFKKSHKTHHRCTLHEDCDGEIDHTGKINIPVGQQIFPNNPGAQASLQAIMSSMGKIHGSQKSVGGERFHPALAGTVPHDPSTHGALNQLDPSTIPHTQALRKAGQK